MTPDQVTSLKHEIQREFDGVNLHIMLRSEFLVLDHIVVPKDKRNEGIGTKIMQRLTAFADANGMAMALTPKGILGSNKARLIKFYRRFGFVPNKGKNKYYEVMYSMVRTPTIGESKWSTLIEADTRLRLAERIFNANPTYNTLAAYKVELTRAGVNTPLPENAISEIMYNSVLALLHNRRDITLFNHYGQDTVGDFKKWTIQVYRTNHGHLVIRYLHGDGSYTPTRHPDLLVGSTGATHFRLDFQNTPTSRIEIVGDAQTELVSGANQLNFFSWHLLGQHQDLDHLLTIIGNQGDEIVRIRGRQYGPRL